MGGDWVCGVDSMKICNQVRLAVGWIANFNGLRCGEYGRQILCVFGCAMVL
jgi:hypothetical protein